MIKRERIAIIPARGGSKRIPNKNIVELLGKPMIAWTIEAALESQLFHRVLVSTDSERIAEVSRQAGADVPFLRDDKNDDHSVVSEATITALRQVREQLGEEYDTVVQLMANCPLRGSKEIRAAYQNFVESGSSSQLSCFRFGWMNPWWAFKMLGDGHAEPVNPGAVNTRSQDLPPLYCPTGAIWMARVKTLEEKGNFYTGEHTFFPIDWKAAIDIDDYEDLEMAEGIMTWLQAKGR